MQSCDFGSHGITKTKAKKLKPALCIKLVELLKQS